jgi:carboxymethylenebutenolidase
VQAPVLGLYGGDDARVGVTVAPAKKTMDELGKSFEYEMFDGAGHGFFRAQDKREGANLRATQQGWKRAIEFLRKNLETK